MMRNDDASGDALDTGDLAVELNTTLARLQDDESSPLFSVKHFPELGLYVTQTQLDIFFWYSLEKPYRALNIANKVPCLK